jgi:hypothetical protein
MDIIAVHYSNHHFECFVSWCRFYDVFRWPRRKVRIENKRNAFAVLLGKLYREPSLRTAKRRENKIKIN